MWSVGVWQSAEVYQSGVDGDLVGAGARQLAEVPRSEVGG